ncbi:MAG: drug/metabolite transporter, family [Blastococcus sp.]|jgi:DME family drug/metabolite transporter|nr:drug/metabolite transporter, family [Blastococcus sp.]
MTPHEGSGPTLEECPPGPAMPPRDARRPHGGALESAAARRGFLLVLLAGITWGTSGFSGSLIASRTDLGPLDIAWYRMTIGAVALFIGYLVSRRRRSAVRPVLGQGVVVRLVLVSAGLAAYQLAYFAAVAQAGVSISTLVALGLAPLLVAVGTSALGHGRPDRSTIAALVAALTGLVLLVGISAGADTGTSVLLGALLATGSALGYAGVTLAGAGVPSGVPVTLIGFAGGAALLTPVALVVGLHGTTDLAALGLLLYLGLVPSALAYSLFFTGLRSVPGPVVSIVTLMEPLTATALATAFLGERLSPGALAGGLLVLAAVAGLYLRRMGDSNSRGC